MYLIKVMVILQIMKNFCSVMSEKTVRENYAFSSGCSLFFMKTAKGFSLMLHFNRVDSHSAAGSGKIKNGIIIA